MSLANLLLLARWHIITAIQWHHLHQRHLCRSSHFMTTYCLIVFHIGWYAVIVVEITGCVINILTVIMLSIIGILCGYLRHFLPTGLSRACACVCVCVWVLLACGRIVSMHLNSYGLAWRSCCCWHDAANCAQCTCLLGCLPPQAVQTQSFHFRCCCAKTRQN